MTLHRSRKTALAALLLALSPHASGCTPSGSGPTPPAAPVVVAPAAPEPPAPLVTATAAAGARAPARPPLPKAPPGIDAARFEVLASICGVASWKHPNGELMVGCRAKPPFQGKGEEPDGRIQEASDFSQVCFLDEFYKGSFTAAGKEQAILGLEACGPDRVNDISPGSVVLAERGADGWSVVAFEAGLNARKCELSKRRDRTLLVCGDNMGAFGDGSLWWGFTLDFAKPPKQRVDVFYKLYKSAGVSCGASSIAVERGLTDFEEVSRKLEDVDGDGIDDLRLTVERAHVNGSDALGKKLDAACQKSGGAMLEQRPYAGKRRRFQLDFRGTATTLVPTPDTKKRLDEWGQAAPSFWWNVVK